MTRGDVERALAEFTFVEPVGLDDMEHVAKHLRGVFPSACVDVFRHTPTSPLTVRVALGEAIYITPRVLPQP